jgi:carbon storage regulator
MLVLSRRANEKIVLGGGAGCPLIEVVVSEIRSDKVRLGITAPDSVPVYRQEIWAAITRDKGEEAA